MRPIDADALRKSVLGLQNCYNGFSDTYDKSFIIGLIDEQPTIKPRKGKWLRYGEDGNPNEKDTVYWQCDQCLTTQIGRRETPMHFCPNCGAQMTE